MTAERRKLSDIAPSTAKSWPSIRWSDDMADWQREPVAGYCDSRECAGVAQWRLSRKDVVLFLCSVCARHFGAFN